MKQFDWNEFYKHTRERPPWPRLMRAISLLAQKERALDLGCGAGRDTRYMLEQGLQVTAVDADAHAMAILATFPQERLRAVQSSFVDFVFERYDLINAHYCLPFLARDQFYAVFGRARAALLPAGIFVGQFFGIHDEWNTPERAGKMTFLTREEAMQALQGLEIVAFEEEDIDSVVADGSPKHWHVFHIIARKALV
ncbi:MAG TPA: class I SAM-dependent methyltransferase [Ktedonobacteraceae bacterium]|nr:class I SAM-dependent methyltransferase [Ktedonobacteraceae bacterium]